MAALRAVRYPKSVITIISFALLILVVSRCEQFGAIPKGEYLKVIEASPHYDNDKDVFVNRRPDILDTMTVGQDFWKDPLGKNTPNFLFNNNQTEPPGPLPEIRDANLTAFEDSGDVIKFIWLGHSTILLSVDNQTILIDPIFSDHASPIPIAAKRFQPPAIDITDLPPIDYIIISHDHYDHRDMGTVKYFINSEAEFLTPLGVGSHLRHWGLEASRITELDWWQAVHNLPKEAVAAFEDLGGRYLVPVHWGMFNLSVHNWYDPPNEITRLSREKTIDLITPRLGQLISLDNPPLYDQWWLEMIETTSSPQ